MDAVPIADLLHEAAETHHRVYRITDGTDPDWASWYADWLIGHSELPTLLGAEPVRSELVYVLVLLDKEYTKQQTAQPWEKYCRPHRRTLPNLRHARPCCERWVRCGRGCTQHPRTTARPRRLRVTGLCGRWAVVCTRQPVCLPPPSLQPCW